MKDPKERPHSLPLWKFEEILSRPHSPPPQKFDKPYESLATPEIVHDSQLGGIFALFVQRTKIPPSFYEKVQRHIHATLLKYNCKF